MGKAASMESIRAALRDRLAHPGRYDSGPDFMNNLPRDQFTEDDIDLWYAADRAWDQHRKHESRRFARRVERVLWLLRDVAILVTLLAAIKILFFM